MGVDPLNAAGVVGTWVAVLLALIALIGILGPLLLLRETRSDRYKALNNVDSQDTGYVTSGIKYRGGERLFRGVKTLSLSKPPHPAKQSLAKSNSTRVQHSSRTGWVNFAMVVEACLSEISLGDNLLVRQGTTWLPVQRFWVLAIGLFGCYGDRHDHGEAFDESNANRLKIELVNEEKDGWKPSPSAQKIYGYSGTLWWRRRLDLHEINTDEIYFPPHATSQQQVFPPESITLAHLFWLALGCLPLAQDNGRVFDLGGFQQNFDSDPTSDEPRQPKFFRYQPRSSILGGGSHEEWVNAIGIDMSQLWCIEKTGVPDNLAAIEQEARADKGSWFIPDYGSYQDFLLRSDVHRLVLGMIYLDLSP